MNDWKNAFKMAFMDELAEINKLDLGLQRKLNKNELIVLSEKIACFCEEFQTILFFYYAFEHSVTEITELFGFTQVAEKITYLNKLLAESIGLKGESIESSSLKSGCQICIRKKINFYQSAYRLSGSDEVRKPSPEIASTKYQLFKKIAVTTGILIILIIIGNLIM